MLIFVNPRSNAQLNAKLAQTELTLKEEIKLLKAHNKEVTDGFDKKLENLQQMNTALQQQV